MSDSSFQVRKKSLLISLAAGVVIGGGLLFYYYSSIRGKKTRQTSPSLSYMNLQNPSIPTRLWLHRIPKIELHAHLHGSIPTKVLAELYSSLSQSELFDGIIDESDNPRQQIQDILKEHKTFEEVFALFPVIHKVIQSKEILQRITDSVLVAFAEENVKYLELRSTPRALKHSKTSRREYVECVIKSIEDFPKKYPEYKSMTTRLILTIDNSKPYSEAEETVKIAHEIRQEYKQYHLRQCPIVGLDFAPKPLENEHMKKYGSLLNQARKLGLKVTIHFAEYRNRSHITDVLKFRPDRLGHAVLLDESDFDDLLNNPIPIEMCPTSNMYTRSIATYEQHPFGRFCADYNPPKDSKSQFYPMIFCTDDCGVFESNLTDEWVRMVKAFALDKTVIKELTMNAIDFSFLETEKEKNAIRKIFEKEFAVIEN